MRYSFDAIDFKSICDQIKTYIRLRLQDETFKFANNSSNECNKKKVVDIDEKIQLPVVAFLTNYWCIR